MKSALVHLATRQTPEATLEAALGWLEQAHAQGADLALLPELFPSGYRYADAPKTPWVLAQLQDFARRSGVTIACGVLEQAGERHANRLRVLAPEGERAVYTKLHLIPAFDEPHTMIPGEKPVALELGGFTAGLSICFDLRFPELYRAHADLGAEILFVPASFTMFTGKDHWELLLRARAVENQCFVVAPGQIGRYEPNGWSYGRSLIADPWGNVIAQASDTEGVTLGVLDFAVMERIRKDLPALRHRRLKGASGEAHVVPATTRH